MSVVLLLPPLWPMLTGRSTRDDSSLVGRSVKRKPSGRICRVVDQRADAYKIHDIGFWTGWVSKKTFAKKWAVM